MSNRYKEFKSKIESFYVDCELVEYLANNHVLLKNKCNGGFVIRQKGRYKHIESINNANKRGEVVRHLKRTVYSSFIKDLYEEFCIYLRNKLFDAACNSRKNPPRLIGNVNISLNPKDIISCQSFEQVMGIAMDEVFRALENKRNTKDLIKGISNRLVKIDEQKVSDALPYLELRHVLVHSDGKPDEKFLKRFPIFKIPKNRKKLLLTHEIVTEAYNKIDDLVKSVDEEIDNIFHNSKQIKNDPERD